MSSYCSDSNLKLSSDSSDGSVEIVEKTEEDLQKEDKENAEAEFKWVFKKWHKLTIDWKIVYPDVEIPEKPDTIRNLMPLEIGRLYKTLEKKDSDRKKYGFLPLMAGCSYGQLGALNAESYAERVNSVGKQVLTSGNSLLSSDEVEMLVILRMNEEFMRFMRMYYSDAVKEAFGMFVLDITNSPLDGDDDDSIGI